MENANLKKKHPQKYYMKKLSKVLFYLGTGECWYENVPLSRNKRFLCNIWVAIANTFAVVFVANQLLAYFRSDLTYKERNDVVQFAMGYMVIYPKIVTLYVKKDRIKELLKKLLEENRQFSSPELDKASVREAMKYCSVMCLTLFMTIFSALVDGIRLHVEEGIPIRTEVTYYPTPSQSGVLVNFVRVLAECHWWFMLSLMGGIDCLCVTSLIFLNYKFKYLQMYFEGLRESFLRNNGKKSQEALEDEFKKDFIVGIKLHDNVLRFAGNLQYTLGNIYSVQVVQTIVLIVGCLLRFVNNERSITVAASIFMYIAGVASHGGAYMVPAGNITHEVNEIPPLTTSHENDPIHVIMTGVILLYQALMLSTSMFHSGWELSRARQNLRSLVVVAMIRSQVRVCMTAFGILELSHANFVSVLRSAYSYFAVMY